DQVAGPQAVDEADLDAVRRHLEPLVLGVGRLSSGLTSGLAGEPLLLPALRGEQERLAPADHLRQRRRDLERGDVVLALEVLDHGLELLEPAAGDAVADLLLEPG